VTAVYFPFTGDKAELRRPEIGNAIPLSNVFFEEEISVKTPLITAGTGFIGSHLANALLSRGDRVRVLDSLDQAHPGGMKPSYLSPEAEFVRGDELKRRGLVA
jgi:hypothetical protein